MSIRKIFFIMFLLTIITFSFAQINNYDYNYCLNNYNLNIAECKPQIIKAKQIYDLINFAYTPKLNNDNFVICVKDQINKKVFDLETIITTCYTSLIQKENLTKPFKLIKYSCNVNDLNILNCKFIIPNTCFDVNIKLLDQNKGYFVEPNVIIKNKECKNLVKFKNFNFKLNNNNYLMLPIKYLDSNYNELNIDYLLNKNYNYDIPPLTSLEKGYLSCVTNYFLHYNYDDKYVYVNEVKFDYNSIYKNCRNNLAYIYNLNTNEVFYQEKQLKNKIRSSVDKYLDSNEKYTDLISDLSFLHNNYTSLLAKSDAKTQKRDMAYGINNYITRIKKAIKNAPEGKKEELIKSFKKTLINDIKSYIEFKNQTNILAVIDFFANELKDINEVEDIITDVKKTIILEIFDKTEIWDLNNIDFTLTPSTLRIENLTFIPRKRISIPYNKEKLYLYAYNNKILVSDDKGVLFETKNSLKIKNNQIYVNNQKIKILKPQLKKGEKIKNIVLELSNNNPIYKVELERHGSFLGLFAITETITKYYNADKLILYDIEKPWWDFFVK